MSRRQNLELGRMSFGLDYVLGKYAISLEARVKNGPAPAKGRYVKGVMFDIEEAKALRDNLSARIRESENNGRDPEYRPEPASTALLDLHDLTSGADQGASQRQNQEGPDAR